MLAVKDRPAPADDGEVGDTTAAGTRCPRCSAAVRPGAPWCTQCYAPTPALTGAPAEVPGPAAALELRPAPVGVAEPVPVAPTGTWPCSACAQQNDLVLAACGGCGTPFLAAARDARPTVVLPVVGDLLGLSPVRRVGLAVCAVVVFVLVSALLALLLA